LELCKKAAEQGLPSAQSYLGLIYILGEGVKVNKFEAYNWLIKAAKQGDEEAQNSLDILCKESPWVCK